VRFFSRTKEWDVGTLTQRDEDARGSDRGALAMREGEQQEELPRENPMWCMSDIKGCLRERWATGFGFTEIFMQDLTAHISAIPSVGQYAFDTPILLLCRTSLVLR
jgi:hypothetical protein